MGNIWALIQLINTLVTAFQWLSGQIETAQFHSRMNSIKDAVAKAKQGKLEDRLKGGQELEDSFNRNA
jgi:hypothetical protein